MSLDNRYMTYVSPDKPILNKDTYLLGGGQG